MTRKLWIAGAAALVVTGAGATAMMTAADGFDSARWKAQAGSRARDNPRAGMVGTVQGRLRPGMTRGEVTELLGPPDTQAGGRASYAIGTSAFGVDYEYFVLEFDGQDKLVRHSVSRG